MSNRVVPGIFCAMALLLATAAAQPAPAPSSLYRIAGTVVNAATGEPVRRATVAALSDADGRTVESVETGDDGRFALEGLNAAKYELAAFRRGFLLSLYDQHEQFNSAIVTGAGQRTEDLIFRLTPGASMRGVVTSDGGDPVENAKVLLFLKPHNPGARITQKAETTTDDTGAYDFGDLTPGEYYLAVTAQPWYALHHSAAGPHQRPESDPSVALDVAYPITFFDSTTEEASATPISLAGGSREEANINLRAVPALHLTFETTAKQDDYPPRAELHQTIFGTATISEEVKSVFGTQTDTIYFNGLAPGRYELTHTNPPRMVAIEASTSQQVDLSLGTPVVAVSGSLRASNGSQLTGNMRVSLNPLDSTQSHALQQVPSIDNSFSFPTITKGRWELVVETLGTPERQLPITSITIGNRTHPGNLLTVQDKPVQMVVTVSLSETRIEGFAKKDEKGIAGVMVVLVSKEPAAFPALARRDQSDSDGSFALRDVAPGQYTVVAIENGWDLDWDRPEVIGRYLPQGVAVTVTESSGKLLRISQAVPVQRR
jgi:hypothetical protein